MATLNSLTYLLTNTKQCPPRSSGNGLCPGQQTNYTNPISINVPVPFGTKCQNAPPLFAPTKIGARDPIFTTNKPTKSYYDLGSAGNWPLKLTSKQKKLLKGKPFTGV